MDAFLPRVLSWMRLLSLRGKLQRLEGLLLGSNYIKYTKGAAPTVMVARVALYSSGSELDDFQAQEKIICS